MTAKIDGQPWASDAQYLSGGVIEQTSGVYLLQGAETAAASSGLFVQLALYNIGGPGTYPLGVGPSVFGGTGAVGNASASWITPLSGASGTVTIDALTPDRISGSFAFTASASTGSAQGARAVTEGEFDLPVTSGGNVAPLSDAAGSRVSADVSGVPWNAATIAVAMTSDHTFILSTSNTAYSIAISLMNVTGTGTYDLSAVTPVRSVLITGPAVDPQGNHCCWGGSVTIANDGTVGSADIGTIAITSLTATRVVGTFSTTLAPAAGSNATAPLVIENGMFDVGIPRHP